MLYRVSQLQQQFSPVSWGSAPSLVKRRMRVLDGIVNRGAVPVDDRRHRQTHILDADEVVYQRADRQHVMLVVEHRLDNAGGREADGVVGEPLCP